LINRGYIMPAPLFVYAPGVVRVKLLKVDAAIEDIELPAQNALYVIVRPKILAHMNEHQLSADGASGAASSNNEDVAAATAAYLRRPDVRAAHIDLRPGKPVFNI
jgi:hypothetical protein